MAGISTGCGDETSHLDRGDKRLHRFQQVHSSLKAHYCVQCKDIMRQVPFFNELVRTTSSIDPPDFAAQAETKKRELS